MTTHLDDDTLQRYYDGELSPVEERIVCARVEADPQAQRQLAEFARLSELMRAAGDELSRGLDSDALFAGIQADLKKQDPIGLGTHLQVVRSEWMEHRRGVVVSFAAAGAIAAAALIAVLAPPATSSPSVATAPRAADTSIQPKLAATEPSPSAVHGSRIENVDFGSNTGTVFEIESKGVTTAVVWISDEDG